MKKLFKFSVSAILVLCILASLFTFNTFAAGTVISLSKKNITVGDTVTVNVTLDAGEAMYSAGCIVNYNSSVLQYKTGTGVGGAGTLKVVESPSGETKYSFSLTFTALASGNGSVEVVDCKYDTLGANGAESKSISGASASVTVNNVSLSGNADLKSLTLSAGTLSPKFSASRTSYSVTVPNSVTECKVYVETADSNATVKVEGSATLKIGSNTRTVIVTAPNGTTKSYTLTITRSEQENVPPVSSDEPTSSEEPSGTDTPENPTGSDNPLEPVVDGVSYTIVTDISEFNMIEGFSPSKTEFGGSEVAVAVDDANLYKIYYLESKEDGSILLCTYNQDDGVFEELKYVIYNDKVYLIVDIPDNYKLPDKYYMTNLTIDSVDFKCFAVSDSDSIDFYYIYCYVNGHHAFYRYDSREDTLQRYPELKMTVADSDFDTQDNTNSGGGIIARFNSLATNAKIIVLCLLVVIICAIALLVLLIVKIMRKNNFEDEDAIYDPVNDFDNISVTDDFSLDTDIEDETDTAADTEESDEAAIETEE